MSNYPTEEEALSLNLDDYHCSIPFVDDYFREYFEGDTKKQEMFERSMYQRIAQHNAHRKVLQDEDSRSAYDEPLAMEQMDHDIRDAVCSARCNRLKKGLGTMQKRDANREREMEERSARALKYHGCLTTGDSYYVSNTGKIP